MEKTDRKPNSPLMDLHLLPPSPPPERRRSARANRFSGSYYYGKQQMNRRLVGKEAAAAESPFSTSKFKNTSTSGKPSPRGKQQLIRLCDGKAAAVESPFSTSKFKNTSTSGKPSPRGKQQMNRRRDGKAAAESPFSTSKFKNTSTSGKPSPRDEYLMAFRHLLATLPRPEPRPHRNLRRSQRLTKFSGRYGYCSEPLPPLHPKLKRFFFITKREAEEFIKDRAPPPPAGPYDGFGLSADEIARLEAMKRNEILKPPPGSRAYVDLDKLVEKYTAEGLSREGVMTAVPIHLHNPTKIPRFVNGYTRLREMGFPRDKVVNALTKYDDDAEKALDYLNNSAEKIAASEASRDAPSDLPQDSIFG